MADREATGPGGPAYEWTSDVEDEILSRIAKGEAIRNICKDDWLPAWSTLNKRLASDSEFSARYARAREEQADTIFDQCLDIADSQEGDIIPGRDGEPDKVNHDAIARAKLRIDTRKWMAGKLRPKVYGDKLDLSSSDGTMTPKPSFDASRLSTAALIELQGAMNEQAPDADES